MYGRLSLNNSVKLKVSKLKQVQPLDAFMIRNCALSEAVSAFSSIKDLTNPWPCTSYDFFLGIDT